MKIMKLFIFIISIIFIGSGFFFFLKNRDNGEVIVPPDIAEAPFVIEGWPDGVPISGALKEEPKELKSKLDTSAWETYTNEKMGIAFRYPSKPEGLVLNLKPRVMEENSAGPWFTMQNVEWLATLHLVESIRDDAEGFFVTSIFKKEGAFEDVLQKVREFEVSGKTFLSERAVKVGALEGVRVATVNKEESSYSIAYILHKIDKTNQTDRIFIIDIAIDQIENPAETEEQFTERVVREQQYFDAVVSTFQVL